MRKIKITEKQAKLLETLNSKKVLKVTKEQYNRIIESELRPSLTETPELHEEEINEELFREFVNELYGMNEEGKEPKFEKLNKVMEAAGLIEGGKLVKEKFGKDTKEVKRVIGKGLMKLEECGSVYEAVQCMEEALTEITSDEIKNRLREPFVTKSSNPNNPITPDTIARDKANDERLPGFEKGHGSIDGLLNLITAKLEKDRYDKYKNKDNKEIINKFLIDNDKEDLRQIRDKEALRKLLKTLNEPKPLDPNQTSMELDEETEMINDLEKTEQGEYSYEEMRNFLSNIIEYFAPFQERHSGPHINIPSDSNSHSMVYELEKELISKFDNFYKLYEDERPVFYIWDIDFVDRDLNKKVKEIKDYRYDINSLLNVAKTNPEKLKLIKVSFDSKKQKDFADMMRNKEFGELDEMDSFSSGSFEGPMNQKPAFKSNVSTELEEANYKKNYYTSPEGRDKPMHNNKIMQELSNQAFDELFGYGAINPYRENGEKFTTTNWYNGEWKTNKVFAEHILNVVSNIARKKGLSSGVIMTHFIMDKGNGIKGKTHAERTYEKYFTNLNESEYTDKIYEALKKKVVAEMDLSNLGNYQYDVNGFEDVDMKGDHETGKGKTFKKPAIKGGKFVKVKDKCKTYPYCNQEIGAVELKNKA